MLAKAQQLVSNCAMFQSVPLMVGLRYTRAKRRNHFISFVSGFSLLGMVFGVLALIVVLSVLNGLDREIKERILRVIPHGFIESDEPIADWQPLAEIAKAHPRVLGAAPYVEDFTMIGTDRNNLGVQLQGILPEAEKSVSVINQHMLVGELDYLQAGEFNIVMGALLARRLGLALGDKVSVATSRVITSPAGITPVTKRFTLVGVFEVGAEVDQSIALIHIEDAQRLFRYRDNIQGLRIKVDDIYQAGTVVQQVAANMPSNVSVKDWSQTQGSLFKAVKMEKLVVTLLLMIIIAIAAFNIVTSLVLMVADKRSDIAVLRTMGMTARQIMAVFVIQGSATGIAGMLLGLVLGSIGAIYIGEIIAFFESVAGQYVFDPNVYYISQLPSLWLWSDALTVASVAIVLSVMATLYPAYRAAKIAPAEALRYE